MKTIEKNRKPKAGLLLVASPRFKNLGEGLSRGTYGERKAADVEQIIGKLDFLDLVYPGVVYERDGRRISHGYASSGTCPRYL